MASISSYLHKIKYLKTVQALCKTAADIKTIRVLEMLPLSLYALTFTAKVNNTHPPLILTLNIKNICIIKIKWHMSELSDSTTEATWSLLLAPTGFAVHNVRLISLWHSTVSKAHQQHHQRRRQIIDRGRNLHWKRKHLSPDLSDCLGCGVKKRKRMVIWCHHSLSWRPGAGPYHCAQL